MNALSARLRSLRAAIVARYLRLQCSAGVQCAEGATPKAVFDTVFAKSMMGLVLRNQAFPPTHARMLNTLIVYRFPFTAANLGNDFRGQVETVLSQMPIVLLQLLQTSGMTIELDVVCDVAAIMDPEKRKLMLSRYFVMDDMLYETCANPVYPYGLTEMITHEIGHCIDLFLNGVSGRLSASPGFLAAFQSDVRQIPVGTLQSYETCTAWRAQYGGYVNMPADLRQASDLSLFSTEEEEVFAEAFAYLMTGNARAVIPQFFPAAIDAVRQLLIAEFARAACVPQELTTR